MSTATHNPVSRWHFLALAFVTLSVSAHEFWIQPATFSPQPGESVALTLQVGDETAHQRSQIHARRIVRFESVTPSGERIDARDQLQLYGAEYDGELRLQTPGAHLLILETDNRAESYLPAERFNAYLKDEGLTPALEHRERLGRSSAEGSERYSRRTKAIVQVGSSTGNAALTQPTGLSLEIVPEVNPLTQPRPERLPVRVFYEGAPLPGALVKLFDLSGQLRLVEERKSDAEGRLSLAMPSEGEWLIGVTWIKPLQGEEVDFETTFSTLTFGLH